MNLVKEHIEEFIRGRKSPFKSLNIGKRTIIKNWFKTWDSNVEYEIDEDLKIHVKGFLWFQRSKITSLPDNLYVEEWLDLSNSKIISLPNNLYVKGFLNIRNTKITSLPNNLHIGGWLGLGKTKITFLPDDLIVVGNIYKDF